MPHRSCFIITCKILCENLLFDLCQQIGIRVDSDNLAALVNQEGMVALVESPALTDSFLCIDRSAELRRTVQVVQCHYRVEDTDTAVHIHRHVIVGNSRKTGQTVVVDIGKS